MCVCVHVCACVCVCVRVRVCMCCVCVCVHVSTFMLYALNFENMYISRMHKHLGPVLVRHSIIIIIIAVSWH